MGISQYPAASWESDRQNRNCLPEIATGAKRPRNDKPESFTPYYIIKRTGRAVRPFSIIISFSFTQDIDGAHAHAEVPALGIGVKIQVDLIALDAAADVLGHAVAIDILAVV